MNPNAITIEVPGATLADSERGIVAALAVFRATGPDLRGGGSDEIPVGDEGLNDPARATQKRVSRGFGPATRPQASDDIVLSRKPFRGGVRHRTLTGCQMHKMIRATWSGTVRPGFGPGGGRARCVTTVISRVALCLPSRS